MREHLHSGSIETMLTRDSLPVLLLAEELVYVAVGQRRCLHTRKRHQFGYPEVLVSFIVVTEMLECSLHTVRSGDEPIREIHVSKCSLRLLRPE